MWVVRVQMCSNAFATLYFYRYKSERTLAGDGLSKDGVSQYLHNIRAQRKGESNPKEPFTIDGRNVAGTPSTPTTPSTAEHSLQPALPQGESGSPVIAGAGLHRSAAVSKLRADPRKPTR